MHLQTQSPAPESPSIPKALPRKTVGGPMRAPSVPPPLPPQPASRQSRSSLPSPKLPPDPPSNEAAPAEEPLTDNSGIPTSKEFTFVATEPNEPSSVERSSSLSTFDVKTESLEND